VREPEILVEQQPPQGVFVCDHAGLVINKFSLQVSMARQGGDTIMAFEIDFLQVLLALAVKEGDLNPQSSILQASILNPHRYLLSRMASPEPCTLNPEP